MLDQVAPPVPPGPATPVGVVQLPVGQAEQDVAEREGVENARVPDDAEGPGRRAYGLDRVTIRRMTIQVVV